MDASIVIHTTPLSTYTLQDRLNPFGTIRRPVSRHNVSAENANMTIALDNADGMLTAAFADPPIRLRCDVFADDEQVFSGSISMVTVAESISLEVQS
jgi:hypothetical protein